MNHVSDQGQPIIPRHLGIVTDGNDRWAKRRGLPRSTGHVIRTANFEEITRYCISTGAKCLTVCVFSTESWKRPSDEIEALTKISQQYLEEALQDFLGEDICVEFLGDLSIFLQHLQDLFARAGEISVDKTGMVLDITANYGSRAELTHAICLLAEQVQKDTFLLEQITENLISQHLHTTSQPDPNLVLCSSEEHRIPNFLLQQSAYVERIIMDKL